MVVLRNISSLLAAGKTPLTNGKIAIFSDALNHASIIDGIRLAERQKSVEIFIYRHCNMTHLNALLSRCTMQKKVVVTDSVDNTVDIANRDNFDNISMIYHKNAAGKSFFKLKTIWGWDDAYVFIGNKNRGIDVISPLQRRTIFTLRSPYLSAVQCTKNTEPIMSIKPIFPFIGNMTKVPKNTNHTSY